MELSITNRELLLNEFLVPLSKISDNAVLKCDNGSITTTIATSDNTIIAHSQYNDKAVAVTKTLNIPDLKKLVRVLSCLNETEIKFDVSSNFLGYSSNETRFKIHLYDDGIISLPRLNFEKLKTIKFDGKFSIKNTSISSLIKGSTITTDSNKIYLATNKNVVRGDLTDMSRANIDSYGMNIADDYEGNNISTPMPLNFEVFRIISSMKFSSINANINTSMNIVLFDIQQTDSSIKLVVSALMN